MDLKLLKNINFTLTNDFNITYKKIGVYPVDYSNKGVNDFRCYLHQTVMFLGAFV